MNVVVTMGFSLLLLAVAPAGPMPAGSAWQAPSDDADTRYFAFHRNGVSLEQAQADAEECLEYAKPGQSFAPPPEYAPLGEQRPPSRATQVVQGGLVGGLIVDVVNQSFASKIGRGNLRRCMWYKGYARYAVDRDWWAWIYRGALPARNLAFVASGEPPRVAALRP